MNIAERLISARTAKGMTIPELAASCGITTEALTAYESGSRIPRDEIKIRIADALGVTLGIFF